MLTPTSEGFYWAKWVKCDPGTADETEFEPRDHWEPVEVYDNGGDNPDEMLRVFVLGVVRTQHMRNFMWGLAIEVPEAYR